MEPETNYEITLFDITFCSNNKDLEFSIFHEYTLWTYVSPLYSDFSSVEGTGYPVISDGRAK
jgi:hypothetical protein